MNIEAKWRVHRPRLKNSRVAILLAVALALILTATALAGTLLSIAGYLDFGYPDTVREPTEGRPEHKLWYHDGKWWASMYSTQANSFTIHRLDWSNQTWVNTGVLIDERPNSRSDALWDGTTLYIVTYVKQENPGFTSNVDNQAWLNRYSYNTATGWTMEGDPRKGIVQHRLKVLSLEKDSTGRLWIAYITRPSGTLEYQVYVRSSSDGGTNWTNELPLATFFGPNAMTAVTQNEGKSDVVGLIAFQDNGGHKLGVMWSNERPGVNEFFFAVHPDGSDYNAGWVMDNDNIPYTANDHINLAKTSSGQVFAAVKTSSTVPGEALNAVVARDLNGSYSFHTINPVESNDTKPIVVVYEPNSGPDKVYVFMSSNPTGGVICSVEAEITTPLSSMSFPVRNCGATSIQGATIVIGDTPTYTMINNATTTRQILNESTDIVLLASDQTNNVYVHTVVIDPPEGPVQQTIRIHLPIVVK